MTAHSLKRSAAGHAGTAVALLAGMVLLAGCSTLGLGDRDAASPAYGKSLQAHVTEHWTPDFYSGDIAGLEVLARLQMNPDGTVAAEPELTVANNSGQTDATVRAYVDSVRQAIRRSQPFPLSADAYDEWRVIELRFNLKEESGK